jgi:hypothetical protein
MDFAGQRWTYRTPPGFAASRIVIGAIVSFSDEARVICVAVAGAPQRRPDGGLDAVTIPFLPLSEKAFAATVVALDGTDAVPQAFTGAIEAWAADPRGLTMFTVPFEGFLDRLIGHQMAEIVGPQTSPALTV